eukprot:scaffold61755_cov45-Attheya_sp.AAC.1
MSETPKESVAVKETTPAATPTTTTTTTTTTATTHQSEEGEASFQEERRILLDNVAESLLHLVRQIGRANENLHGMVEGCREVEEVSTVWKDAFRADDLPQEDILDTSN